MILIKFTSTNALEWKTRLEKTAVRNFLLRQILDHICCHYTEQIDSASVCKRFRISERHLHHLFQSSGTTFSFFRGAIRIQEACRLLAEYPELTIEAVGRSVGYPYPSYFAKIFRAYTGLSPKEYVYAGTPAITYWITRSDSIGVVALANE